MIYLDHNATTPPTPAVRQRIEEALSTLWANPSSIHRPGQAARHALELARNDLAALIGVPPRTLILTSGGTESIDLAIRGTLLATRRRAIVTSRAEHAAVRDLCAELERAGEAEVRWAPPGPSGLITPASIEPLLDDTVALVSIQWANNETGTIQPVEAIAALCRARGARFHCDATQWVGKMPARVGEDGLAADLLTFSAHKFHGPKGIGALYIRHGVGLRPTLWGAQELGRRGGTENVPGILGAGVASREAASWLADPGARDAIAALRDRLESLILTAHPWAVVNGVGAPRLWNTSSIAFPRLEAEAILLMLSERGVCASAGAACSSGSLEPSPVLLAMGIAPEVAHGSVRFSLSRETTADEIDRAASIVIECIAALQRSSAGIIAGAGGGPPGSPGA